MDYVSFTEPQRVVKRDCTVYIVGPDVETTGGLRRFIKTLRFRHVQILSDIETLKVTKLEPVDVVMLYLRNIEKESLAFVKSFFGEDDGPNVVVVVDELDVSLLFDFLSNGAKAFLVLPFSVDSVEEAIMFAQSAPEMDPAVFSSEDRNLGLSACLLNNFNRAARALKKHQERMIGDGALKQCSSAFKQSAQIAHNFKDGDDDALRARIVDELIRRAEMTETKLQKTRRKLKNKRGADGPPSE